MAKDFSTNAMRDGKEGGICLQEWVICFVENTIFREVSHPMSVMVIGPVEDYIPGNNHITPFAFPGRTRFKVGRFF
jgi:hypothetical protein